MIKRDDTSSVLNLTSLCITVDVTFFFTNLVLEDKTNLK